MFRKSTWMVFLLLPVAVWSQWRFNDGSVSDDLVWPMIYRMPGCDFRFDVDDGTLHEVIINNDAGCSGSIPKLAIDGYRYDIFGNAEVVFNATEWEVVAQVNFGNCSTESGQPIDSNGMNLTTPSQSFVVDLNYLIRVHNVEGDTYFEFRTTNGDVVCDEGVPYKPEQIYIGDFE